MLFHTRFTKIVCFSLFTLSVVSAETEILPKLKVRVKRKYHNLYSFPLGASEIKASAIKSSLKSLSGNGPFIVSYDQLGTFGELRYDISFDKKNNLAKIQLSLNSPYKDKNESQVRFSLSNLSQDQIFDKLETMGTKLSKKFLQSFSPSKVLKENIVTSIKEVEEKLIKPAEVMKKVDIKELAERNLRNNQIDNERKSTFLKNNLRKEYFKSYIKNIENNITTYYANKGKIPSLENLKLSDPYLYKKVIISEYNVNPETRNYNFKVLNKGMIQLASVQGNIMNQDDSIIKFTEL